MVLKLLKDKDIYILFNKIKGNHMEEKIKEFNLCIAMTNPPFTNTNYFEAYQKGQSCVMSFLSAVTIST